MKVHTSEIIVLVSSIIIAVGSSLSLRKSYCFAYIRVEDRLHFSERKCKGLFAQPPLGGFFLYRIFKSIALNSA